MVASAGGEESCRIYVWNHETGKMEKNFGGHTKTISSLDFINDDTFISCSTDGTLRIWSCSNPKVLSPVYEMEERLLCMAQTPDHKIVAIGSEDGSILFWGISEKKVLRRKEVHESKITGIACSPSGLMIASASQDGTGNRHAKWTHLGMQNGPTGVQGYTG